MSKEGLMHLIVHNNRARDIAQRFTPFYLWQKYGYHWLDGEERRKLHALISTMRAKEITPPSEQMNIISRYNYEVAGLKNLQDSKGQGLMVISNHFADAPFAYFPFVILMNKCVKDATGKELSWYQGDGSSITSFIREDIIRSGNTIPVNGKESSNTNVISIEAYKAKFAKENIANFAEGSFPEAEVSEEGKRLRIGNPRAGDAISKFSNKEIKIVPIGVWFHHGTFFINIGEPLSPEEIKQRAKSSKNKQDQKQAVADYGMEEIARLLPFRFRGAYKNMSQF